MIFSCGVVGLLFGIYNLYLVLKIDTSEHSETLLDEFKDQVKVMNLTASHIQEGANAFLMEEYRFMAIFIVLFSGVILAIDSIEANSFKAYTMFAFLIGASASIASGYIGMYIATRTNVRVTYSAACIKNDQDSLKEAFNAAFRGGCVMGFILVSLALIMLALIIIIFKAIIGDLKIPSLSNDDDDQTYSRLFEYVAGYGLGGSTVALFCRVGGGIYTKAADVGADLVGKNEFGLGEDSPDNPATIADNVGDNVGDIAGMGSDLFGSFAESTCAALVVSGTSDELVLDGNYLYPLMLSAGGIIVCLITSFVATNIMTVTEKHKIEKTLRWQLIISSVLLTPLIIILSLFALPETFRFQKTKGEFHNWGAMICALSGLWCGMIIGYLTDVFTSTEYSPVQKLAESCKSGAAINIIQGLALGYLSTVVPMISLASKLLKKLQFVLHSSFVECMELHLPL
jgi:inorganic pyrophosphatase